MSVSLDQLIHKMQSTRNDLLALVSGLGEEASNWRPPDKSWSIRENLAHLVDAEKAHRRFMEAVLAGTQTSVENFDLDRWNQSHVARRANQSTTEILADLQAERERTLAFFLATSAEKWLQEGDHPVLGRVSIRQVAKIIGMHEQMHLKEIRKLLEQQARIDN